MRNPRVTAILSRITDDRGRPAPLPVRLCAEALSALPVTGVSVALMTAGGPKAIVLAATDRRSRQLEEAQSGFGEGPGVDAFHTGRPVLQPDLAMAGPTRWPKFCKTVVPIGIRAVFAFPLAAGDTPLGTLDLYRDAQGRLTRPELVDALAFADAATVVLLHLRDRSRLDGGRSAVTGPVVHDAAGMITVQLGVSHAEALLRLRAHAYATGRTITAVAADVVGRRLHFGSELGGTEQDQMLR
jgi:GAF domain-containing protein